MTCPHVSLPTGLVPLQGPTGGQGVPGGGAPGGRRGQG